MRRLSWVFIVIITIVVGWYFLWLKSLEKVETFIASNIEQLQISNSITDVDVHYTLKPKGFPFKAGYVVENVKVIFDEKDTQHHAEISTKGYSFVYVSIFDFYKLFTEGNIRFNTSIQDFEGVVNVESPKDNVEVRFNIARSLGEGVWGTAHSFEGTLSDLDIYVSLKDVKDKRILTVNQLKLKNENSVADNLLSALSNLDVLGATFYDLEGENSFEVDQFKFAFDVSKLPLLTESSLNKLRSLNFKSASTEQLDNMKNQVLDYFNQMKDAGTSIQLKDYKVKIDEFMGSLDFKMRLNDQLKPVGRAEVKFKNIAALNHLGGISEAPVDLSLFSEAGQEEVSVNFESDGKRIYLNGLPVLMFVPSIDIILENLWPTDSAVYQLENKYIIDKTDELADEVTSVDINNLNLQSSVSATVPNSVSLSEKVSLTGVILTEELDGTSAVLSVSSTIDTVSETADVSG
ncbi:MAG: hypothetical protein CFH43_00179 [Proteobacteria bacterium]|nr:MAG: hypothetical protein CFH43_00179 [Pseudomonadota bacterium]